MGDEAPVPEPKVPTLPFKPPEFDWSSPNIIPSSCYLGLSAIMLLKGLTVVTPKRPKLVQI